MPLAPVATAVFVDDAADDDERIFVEAAFGAELDARHRRRDVADVADAREIHVGPHEHRSTRWTIRLHGARPSERDGRAAVRAVRGPCAHGCASAGTSA